VPYVGLFSSKKIRNRGNCGLQIIDRGIQLLNINAFQNFQRMLYAFQHLGDPILPFFKQTVNFSERSSVIVSVPPPTVPSMRLF